MRRAAFTMMCATTLLAYGCATEEDGVSGGDAVVAADGGAPDASSDGGADTTTWLPPQCEGATSPLLDPACLAALGAACETHETERDCSAQPTLNINSYEFRCGWARFIRFANPQSCEGISSSGRCVAAYLDVLQPCGNPCEDMVAPNMWDSFDFSSAGELIEKPCAPRGGHLAPVLSKGCLGPGADPVCSCAQAACDSL